MEWHVHLSTACRMKRLQSMGLVRNVHNIRKHKMEIKNVVPISVNPRKSLYQMAHAQIVLLIQEQMKIINPVDLMNVHLYKSYQLTVHVNNVHLIREELMMVKTANQTFVEVNKLLI